MLCQCEHDSWSIVRYDCSNPELGVARYSINLRELSFATALVASAVDHNDNWTKPVQPSTHLSLSPHTIFAPLVVVTQLSLFLFPDWPDESYDAVVLQEGESNTVSFLILKPTHKMC